MSPQDRIRSGVTALVRVVGKRSVVIACVGIAIIGAMGLASSRKQVHFSIEPPAEKGDVNEVLSTDESIISVPFVIPLDTVKSVLEEKVPRELNGVEHPDIDHLTGERLDWKLSRQPVSVEPAGGSGVVFGTSILGEAGFNAGVVFGIFNVRAGARAEAITRLKLAPTVAEDWRLIPNLAVHEFRVTQATGGEVYAAGIKVKTIDIAGKLTEVFNQGSSQWIAEANEKIASQTDLRPEAQKAWNELHLVERVASIGKDNSIGVWLAVDPKELTFKPMDSSAGTNLTTGIAVKADVRTYISQSAPERPAPGELPNLKIDSDMPADFTLHLPVACSLTTLNTLVDSDVEGRTFKDDARGIECLVDEADVLGRGSRIVVRVKADARYGHLRAAGTLYLVGDVELDNTNQTLRIANLDYSVETKNALVKTADWLLHSSVVQQLGKEFTIKYTKEIELAKLEASKQLEKAKAELPPGIHPSLQGMELDIERLTILNGHLLAVVAASGQLTVELRDFP